MITGAAITYKAQNSLKTTFSQTYLHELTMQVFNVFNVLIACCSPPKASYLDGKAAYQQTNIQRAARMG